MWRGTQEDSTEAVRFESDPKKDKFHGSRILLAYFYELGRSFLSSVPQILH
jgi:hypothetical protein